MEVNQPAESLPFWPAGSFDIIEEFLCVRSHAWFYILPKKYFEKYYYRPKARHDNRYLLSSLLKCFKGLFFNFGDIV